MAETQVNKRADRRREDLVLQQQWHGWASPIGMGIGLMSVGGFYALLSLGINIMASTGY